MKNNRDDFFFKSNYNYSGRFKNLRVSKSCDAEEAILGSGRKILNVHDFQYTTINKIMKIKALSFAVSRKNFEPTQQNANRDIRMQALRIPSIMVIP